jgi:hypothetical protein
MDLTQILGMGFLCIALIWIIHVSLEKRANERRNIWYDEDPDAQSDDQFYQALRKELYDDSSPKSYSGGPDKERFSRESTPEDRTTLLRSTCPVLVSLQKDRSPDLPLDRDHLILGKDIFGRDANFERVEIDDSYPQYLRDHLDEYSHFVLGKITPFMKFTHKMDMTVGRFFRKAYHKVFG